MKKNILLLESLSTISGGQAVLLQLLPPLKQHYRLFSILPENGPLAAKMEESNVKCSFAPMGNYTLVKKSIRDVLTYSLLLPRLVFFARHLIRQQNIDLVYANSGRTFVWGTLAALLTGCPIIWHHHNLLGDGKTLTALNLLARLPVVKRIICASQTGCQQFPASANKTIFIPTGIDLHQFRPDPAARAKLRCEFGILPGKKVVGIIGDLIPLKRQHTLLAAIPTGPTDTQYLIIGDTRANDNESREYTRRLKTAAPANVIFTGHRNDIADVLNALDMLVIASERETGPLVLLEALACGVPVISTPVGRAPGLLPPENLFPVNDAAALANRLQSAPAMPPAEIIQSLSFQQFHLKIQTQIHNLIQEIQ